MSSGSKVTLGYFKVRLDWVWMGEGSWVTLGKVRSNSRVTLSYVRID